MTVYIIIIQATDACQKIMLRKSSQRKKVGMFLSKNFLLNPLTPNFLKFC